MSIDQDALSRLVAKDEIRDLALLYCRGVDRKDFALLRTLYTRDGVDSHGQHFNGPAEEYVQFLERSLTGFGYTGHHVCNHLISVDGDQGEGEVYALAYHLIPDGKGGLVEDLQIVRYIDRYRKEDGRWRFASRVVSFDLLSQRPALPGQQPPGPPAEDPSYRALSSRLFARGPRI
jgi:hypothetical protein